MRDLEKTVNGRIRAILKEKDMSVNALVTKSGISSGYLTELLSLHPKKRWNAELLEKVCNALNVPAWHLFVDPKQVIPGDLFELSRRYERLNGDNKRIVDAMLAAATTDAREAQPAKRPYKKRAT